MVRILWEDELQKLRTALVGYGWWGRKMAALVAGRGGLLELVTIVEPMDDARAEADAAGFTTSASFKDTLADPNIDAVILATPHKFHTEQVAAAANAGKHVFCEKPLALTAAEARQSVDLCQSKGLVLGMGHERRFEPAVAELLADIKAGKLGRIVQIEANFSHDKFVNLPTDNWRLDPSNAPLAGMTATGIHLTDLSIAILGKPSRVDVHCQSLVSKIPQGDTFSAHVAFEDGGTSYVVASLGIPFVSKFAVYGSKGWVEIRDKTHVEAPTGWTVFRSDGESGATSVTEIGPAEAVFDNLQAFAGAALGQGNYPIPGSDIIQNIALLEAMGRSQQSGQVENV